jgi:hypothetical protein
LNLDHYEKALIKEQNNDINILNKYKDTNENEKYNNNEIRRVSNDQDNLIEYYPINQQNSLDIIKQLPLSFKSNREDISNLPKVNFKIIFYN